MAAMALQPVPRGPVLSPGCRFGFGAPPQVCSRKAACRGSLMRRGHGQAAISGASSLLLVGIPCRRLSRAVSKLARQGQALETAGVSKAAVRRAARAAEYERMKRQSLFDVSVTALLGALLAFFNSGLDAAEGWVFGSAFAALYLLLLQKDVDMLAPGRTPFDLGNPLRVLRFLLPLALVMVLGVQVAVSLGDNAPGVSWEPGINFTGVVSSPAMLFGALVGYALGTAVLPLRGIVETLPEARTLVKAVPGSVGVALRLADEAPERPLQEVVVPAEEVPVLIVTGPRGTGKSSLVNRLRQSDSRFQEPTWAVTGKTAQLGSAHQQVVREEEFDALAESGSLAVSYSPCGEDLEQINVGLPAMAVMQAAMAGQACVLDVDPPTARNILSYNWSSALAAAFPDKKAELRLVSVWVSLNNLDEIIERNRTRLEAQGLSPSTIKKQLAPLRSQVISDMEWALTSGDFDFTIINQDEDKAAEEVSRAARYCFEDPF